MLELAGLYSWPISGGTDMVRCLWASGKAGSRRKDLSRSLVDR